jgi:hypothetical protein
MDKALTRGGKMGWNGRRRWGDIPARRSAGDGEMAWPEKCRRRGGGAGAGEGECWAERVRIRAANDDSVTG